MMGVEKLAIQTITDPRGNLSFIEYPGDLPFSIRRVFWTYNVPGGETRGGHAYRHQHELIIALSGSIDVVVKHLDESVEKITLNRGYLGLYIPPGTWRHIENFSTNAVCLHLSSMVYDEEDYVRDFKTYKELFG